MTRNRRWLAGFVSAFACGSDEQPREDESSVSLASITNAETGASDTVGDDDGAKLDLGPQADMAGADETSGECAAQTLEGQQTYLPIDVILVVDTSNSMADAIAAVEASINADFAAVLGGSGLDYRVLVLGDYPPAEQLYICISMPLSGTDCNPPPPIPATTPHYQQYDAITGSGAFLDNILAWYSAPDPHGLAPGGWSDWLRPEAQKLFLAMTDGSSASNSNADGDAFDAALLALPGSPFGMPGDRRYVFHSIISMEPNNPPQMPWLPADPIQGNGDSIQQVSVVSGGWRFPLSLPDDFDVVFQQIAEGVVESTPVACSFPIPEPPEGETIDPNTIEIDYLPGGVGAAESFHQVVGPAECAADAFYISADTIFLCPEACALVQADVAAQLDVRYGCDVGFVPQG
jgi:hypothetical protein